MPQRLTFKHIEAVRAVVQTGSVTGAAARLFVTQPAVSHIIRDTEAIAGYPLFDRQGGRLFLTTRGRLLMDEIDRAYISIDVINATSERLREDIRKMVTLNSIYVAAVSLVPSVFKAYRETVEDVFFALKTGTTEDVVTSVATQKCDFGIGLYSPKIPGVKAELLFDSPILCVMPKGHELAGKTRVSADELRRHPIISTPRRDHIDDLSQRFFGVEGMPNFVAESEAAFASFGMVQAGMGLTLLDPVSTFGVRNPDVICRGLDPEISVPFYLYSVADRDQPINKEVLCKMLRDRQRYIIDVMVREGMMKAA